MLLGWIFSVVTWVRTRYLYFACVSLRVVFATLFADPKKEAGESNNNLSTISDSFCGLNSKGVRVFEKEDYHGIIKTRMEMRFTFHFP